MAATPVAGIRAAAIPAVVTLAVVIRAEVIRVAGIQAEVIPVVAIRAAAWVDETLALTSKTIRSSSLCSAAPTRSPSTLKIHRLP